MEAKVPQRIDMEDKVIGPLTLVQFFYLLFGGLIIYILNSWTTGTPFRIFFYIIAIPLGLLSLALAFVKIQDRPFIFFLGALVRYMQRPRQRYWAKGEHPVRTKIIEKVEEDPKAVRKPLDRARISDLARVLDNSGKGGPNA